MSILNQARSLADEPPFIKAIIYGAEGAGKTYFSGSAPKPIWIDFERSSETLRSVEHLKNTKVFRPKRFDDVREFFREASKQYETIVIDTITTMQVFYMREYMAEQEEATKTKSGSQKRDKFLSYQGDFRYATAELTDFFLELQEAPVNVIMLAHVKEMYKKVEDNMVIDTIRPEMTPAVWSAVRAFVNVVGYLERTTNGVTKRVDRRLYLNSTNIIQAKNRLGIDTESVLNPDFKELFK